jgi:hypothetical protein
MITPLSSLQLIGITGHAGSGKDTVASYIQKKYKNTYIEHFADPLKKACATAFGIPENWFYDRELKEQETPWAVSPRKIAQFVGTEMFRTIVADLYEDHTYSHWIRLLEMRLTGVSCPPEGEGDYYAGDTIIISDVRFQDEADWIRQNRGIILRITRQGFEGSVGIQGHASEISYASEDYLICNDNSKEILYATVDEFINHYTGNGILKLTPEQEESTNGYTSSDF